jgi:hypothetical protein
MGVKTLFRSRIKGALFAASVLLSVATPSSMQSQCGPCQNTASGVGGPYITPYLDSTQVCAIDDQVGTIGRLSNGAWVRQSTSNTLKQGAGVTVTGQCAVRGCSGSNCVTYFTQTRDLNTVPLSYYDPNLNPPGNFPLTWYGTTPPSRQSIDSDASGTTNGPLGRKPNIEGLWTFRYWALTTTTNCFIQPTTSPETTIDINVEVCKPEWNIYGSPTKLAHPPPGSPITIVVPGGMSDIIPALTSAAGYWEGRTGATIHVALNGDCLPNDGLCIFVDETYTGTGCEGTGGSSHDAAGQYTSPTTLNMRSNWRQSHQTNLTSDLSHELGHFFGLGDREHSSCSCASTIMSPVPAGWVCNDPNPYPSNCATGPTLSDGRVLPRSSNREVCGW